MPPSICFHLHKLMEILLKRYGNSLFPLFSDSGLKYLGFYSKTSGPPFRLNSWVRLQWWHTSLIHTMIETIFAFATMQSTTCGQLESTTPPMTFVAIMIQSTPAHIHLSWLHPQRWSQTQPLILSGIVLSLVYSMQRYNTLAIILSTFLGSQWTSFGSDG